jgi:hypothetical protein
MVYRVEEVSQCCLFEFPEENDSIAIGYLDFIIPPASSRPTTPQANFFAVSDKVYKLMWPICVIRPPNVMSRIVKNPATKWKKAAGLIKAIGSK